MVGFIGKKTGERAVTWVIVLPFLLFITERSLALGDGNSENFIALYSTRFFSISTLASYM
jgi:hypothetical protein